MLPHKIRVRLEEAMKVDIAAIYRSARESGPWQFDPFAVRFGPDLQRRPELERLFTDSMLREIDAAMKGQEDQYIQFQGLLDLLQLQRHWSKPAAQRANEQRAFSQWFCQSCGLDVPQQYTTLDMLDYEYDATIVKVSSFLTSKAPSEEVMRLCHWAVPLVLRTVYDTHAIQARDRHSVKTVVRRPTLLQPEGFLWWFQQRLVHAVTLRRDKYPQMPLWASPRGRQTIETRPATPQDYHDFAALLEALYQPTRPGRPPGRKNMSEDEFWQRYSEMYQKLLDAYDSKPRRYEVAEALDIDAKTFRTYLHDFRLPFPPF